MSEVVRWTFYDPEADESIVVPINPNRMDSPTRPRNMQFAWGSKWGLDRIRGIDLATPASTWTFGGVFFQQTHHDLLLAWAKRLTVLHVTDHLERTFEIVIQKFDVDERLPTPRHDWRGTYTITAYLLGEL